MVSRTLGLTLVVLLAVSSLACQDATALKANVSRTLSAIDGSPRVSQVPACIDEDQAATSRELTCGPMRTVDADKPLPNSHYTR